MMDAKSETSTHSQPGSTGATDADITQLEPRHLWRRFDQLRRIPRPSKHEERVRRWALEIAAKHGCKTLTDKAGNVVIQVPATPGCEGAPIVVIQGHLDMVCEKNAGTEFDFFKDPIRLELDGDRLTAQGTTLGADNGVAIAAGLALLTDDSVKHGPLELLFTVDEETGLNGARDLDPAIVSGRLLLNLDSEEEGVLTIGCAGARSAVVTLPVTTRSLVDTGRADAGKADAGSAADGARALRLEVAGATGGHSGGEIHLGRANAVRVLGLVLGRLLPSASLASLTGGSAPNVIPREASAVIVGDRKALAAEVEEIAAALRSDYADTDPELRIELWEQDESPSRVLTEDSARQLVDLLLELPHGVRAMSRELPGLVQTSANLATVRLSAEAVEFHCSNRSSVDADLDAAVAEIVERAEAAGASVHTTRGYPGWAPNTDSNLLALAVEMYRRLYDRAPEVSAVHAGLECGIIGEKIPDMEMISFGPDIRNPHSPDEFVSVGSVERVLGDYLSVLLGALGQSSPTSATGA